MTTLIACSHGTDSPEGRSTVTEIVDLVRARLPETRVVQAYVDVQEPTVHDVVERESRDDEVVVVPLLLSAGFHTAVDITEAVSPHANARQTEPLGTHPLIMELLLSRILETLDGGWKDGDHVVLAAAGSRNPAAAVDIARTAEGLARLVPVPLTVGYASAIDPRISAAVADARHAGARRVIAASHVLAPGFFAGLVERAGAEITSAPLGADARVADVIVDRFRSSS